MADERFHYKCGGRWVQFTTPYDYNLVTSLGQVERYRRPTVAYRCDKCDLRCTELVTVDA